MNVARSLLGLGLATGTCLALATLATGAGAQGPAPDAGGSDAAAPTGGSVGGCVESIPRGAQHPIVTDVFPIRGTSGWAATLQVTVKHGKGERVLPAGLDLGGAVEAKKYLQKAGFAIPEQDGGAGAQLWTDPEDKNGAFAVTHLELPLVLLPEKPGRNTLELPPLPVAIARSNGEIATVCTHPHLVAVEDPTANTPQAAPRGNPPPRPQREEWTALKKALLWSAVGLVVGAVLAYFIVRQMRKPKPVPPPPPPRPPWEVALEKLEHVRRAGLLDEGRDAEYFDRVSDAVRGYLGARFGFDGLESTSDEILASLKKQAGGFVRLETAEADAMGAPTPGVPLAEIRSFLGDCDLVKFANLRPSPEQCSSALVSGEHIIRATMPFSHPGAALGRPAAQPARVVPPPV
ncbi:MAG: hypothetical protein JWP97_3389, partial [Labilithrix sp.]|nr:hypothetical protein [Labilithrix sp.]